MCLKYSFRFFLISCYLTFIQISDYLIDFKFQIQYLHILFSKDCSTFKKSCHFKNKMKKLYSNNDIFLHITIYSYKNDWNFTNFSSTDNTKCFHMTPNVTSLKPIYSQCALYAFFPNVKESYPTFNLS